MQGSANSVADALSRLSVNALHTSASPPVMDFRELALAQVDDPELNKLREDSSLRLELIPLALADGLTITCDTSTGVLRPYVPIRFRRAIFDMLHSMAHPGIHATQHLVTSHCVWPGINCDVRR